MRIYQSGTQVIIATEGNSELHSVPSVETAMTLYEESVAITKGVNGNEYVRVRYVNVLDGDGVLVGDKTQAIAYLSDFISAQEVSLIDGTQVNVSKNQLGYNAWGGLKVTHDKSILHGMFTFNVPAPMWYEKIGGVEQTLITRTQSVDGELVVTAGATLNDVCELRSFRSPRYQPNRGHLYSTAGFLDDPDSEQIREWGVFTSDAGVFFRLTGFGFAHLLQGVIRTTRGGVVIEDTVNIDETNFDITKGNVFDIQFQWRGVGNYNFFVNLDNEGSFSYLGTLDNLSMYNPALPISFRSENLGGNASMRFGCVDVTSEGGDDNGNVYGSVGISTESGQVAVTSGFNVPILAIRSKKLIGTLENTRDTVALMLSAYSDQRSFVRVWATRDFTAITENDQSWKDYGDGHLEYIEYDNPDVASPMTFDTTKAINTFGNRVDQDVPFETSALFDGRANIDLTVGDMFVFTMHRETGASFNCGVSFEFAEAI